MPIALAPINEQMQIIRVVCDSKENARLASLGVTKGASIVILNSQKGAVVILVKGSRLALDRGTASRIFVA